MKKIIAPFVLLLCSSLLWAGGKAEQSQSEHVDQPAEIVSVHISVPSGAPTVAVAPMATASASIAEGYNLDWEVVTSPDLMGARLVSGEADIAIVPSNLAARLYNQGQDIKVAGGVVWGILYVVGTEQVSSWDDLAGRQVAVFGRGLTPDLVFRHVAMANGLHPDEDLSLNYYSGASELAPALLSGTETIALVPEPVVSMVLARNNDAHILFDLQNEWAELSGSASSYPQAVLVIQGSLLESHPDFVEAFLQAFAESTAEVNADDQQAGIAAASLMEGTNPGILSSAVPRMKIDFRSGDDFVAALNSYLSVLLTANPQALSGDLPDDGFYQF